MADTLLDEGTRQFLIQVITAFVGGMIAVVFGHFIRALINYIRSIRDSGWG